MQLNEYMRRSAQEREMATAAGILVQGDISPRRAIELRSVIEVAMESFDDETARKYPELVEPWRPDQEYDADKRLSSGKDVYKVRQKHTSQTGHEPGAIGTESLYYRIDETHAGTLDDPIPAKANMLYEKGKYYVEEGGGLYLCTRDDSTDGTGTILQYLPSALVNLYFEAISG